MSSISKIAAGSMVVCAFLFFSGAIPEVIVLPVFLVACYLVQRELGGFWRALFGGMLGGAVAGVLILGPGFRLAMRAVALMDPIQPEEFTVGGTLFIIILVGGIIGAITATVTNILRWSLGIASPVWAGALLGSLLMVDLVFFSGDVSDEIFQLGISPWINIPLFGLYALAYGIAAMAIADSVGRSMFSRRGDTELAKVRA